jgi:competence protein ComEC
VNMPRRPMVPAAAGFSVGILAGYYTSFSLWIGIIAAVLFLFLCFGKKNKAVLIFLFFLAFGSLTLCRGEGEMEKARLILGEKVTVKGEVLSLKTKEDKKHQMEVETDQGRILVRWYDVLPGDGDLVGREVRISGTIEEPPGRRNPKCFDYRLYLKTRNIHVMMTADQLEVGGVSGHLNYWASKTRNSFEDQLLPFMKEENRQVVMAMLFGDKSGLGEEGYERFQRNGTAHLLAASGLHVGVVYGFLLLLLRGRRNAPAQLVIIGSLVFYAAMAGFAPSIIRAVIMITLHILSRLFHYRYDLLSAASFTALVMLVANPYALFGLGFQMSFLAILSLSMFNGALAEQQNAGLIKKGFMPILIIQGAMAPFTAYAFNYFSFMAFLANVPMVFLAGILIPIGMVTLAAGLVPGAPPELLGIILDKATSAMVACNDLFYGEGHGAVDVVSPPLLLLALYYLLGFYLFSETRKIQMARKKYGKMAGQLGALVLAAFIFTAVADDKLGESPIVFVDVGQGSCLCITTPKGRVILVDGGGSRNYDVGKKTLKPYLLKNGMAKVDLAIVSHLDEDHYGGIRFLREDGMVDKLILGKGEERKAAGADLIAETGQVIYREEDFSICVLGPLTPGDTENENSLVIKIRYKDVSLLAPGDISADKEAELVRAYGGGGELSAHILAVPHHGSKYSSSEEFIGAVNPAIAIIQVGKNNYGHPAPSVIEKYEKKRIMVYRNDVKGAIAIERGDNGSIQLQTQQ